MKATLDSSVRGPSMLQNKKSCTLVGAPCVSDACDTEDETLYCVLCRFNLSSASVAALLQTRTVMD